MEIYKQQTFQTPDVDLGISFEYALYNTCNS